MITFCAVSAYDQTDENNVAWADAYGFIFLLFTWAHWSGIPPITLAPWSVMP